ncbi:WXG100-like domain-containing protein [Actinokineospora bangkokensis]|uniref:Outer membrane channel protein CpnT-like N-terminal domain-containing protein n=1 Tax=Actinokineospora bangkokensis TaxID=1193682 RepID=A0A1Q9LTG4_9PSEU|nr:hypothetical protein [Actinokineospora bangkokensis]OLR95291.1 hypothetical protein BJP25_07355 [Actinokineospora bangkokensis]
MREPNDSYGFWETVKYYSIDQLWPPDDEDVAWQLAAAWKSAAEQVEQGAQLIDTWLSRVPGAWPDLAGIQYSDSGKVLGQNYRELATAMRGLADGAQQYGTALRETKNSILIEIAVNLALYIALSALPGGALLAHTLARAVAGRLSALVMRAAGASAGAFRTGAVSALATLTRGGTMAGFEIAGEAVEETVLNLAQQGMRIAEGRADGIDAAELGTAAVTGAVGGALGSGLGTAAGAVGKRLNLPTPTTPGGRIAAATAGAAAQNAVVSPTANHVVQSTQNGTSILDGQAYAKALKDGAIPAAAIGGMRAHTVSTVQELNLGNLGRAPNLGPVPALEAWGDTGSGPVPPTPAPAAPAADPTSATPSTPAHSPGGSPTATAPNTTAPTDPGTTAGGSPSASTATTANPAATHTGAATNPGATHTNPGAASTGTAHTGAPTTNTGVPHTSAPTTDPTAINAGTSNATGPATHPGATHTSGPTTTPGAASTGGPATQPGAAHTSGPPAGPGATAHPGSSAGAPTTHSPTHPGATTADPSPTDPHGTTTATSGADATTNGSSTTGDPTHHNASTVDSNGSPARHTEADANTAAQQITTPTQQTPTSAALDTNATPHGAIPPAATTVGFTGTAAATPNTPTPATPTAQTAPPTHTTANSTHTTTEAPRRTTNNPTTEAPEATPSTPPQEASTTPPPAETPEAATTAPSSETSATAPTLTATPNTTTQQALAAPLPAGTPTPTPQPTAQSPAPTPNPPARTVSSPTGTSTTGTTPVANTTAPHNPRRAAPTPPSAATPHSTPHTATPAPTPGTAAPNPPRRSTDTATPTAGQHTARAVPPRSQQNTSPSPTNDSQPSPATPPPTAEAAPRRSPSTTTPAPDTPAPPPTQDNDPPPPPNPPDPRGGGRPSFTGHVAPVPHSDLDIAPDSPADLRIVPDSAVLGRLRGIPEVDAVQPLGAGRFLVELRSGHTVVVSVLRGPTADDHPADFAVDGVAGRVVVSTALPPSAVEQVVVDAVAQIAQRLGGNDIAQDRLAEHRFPGTDTGLSPADHGRQAELRALDSRLTEARLARRRAVAGEMRALVEHLGLNEAQPGHAERRALLDPDVARILDERGDLLAKRPRWATKDPTTLPPLRAYVHQAVMQALPGTLASTAAILTAAPQAGPIGGIAVGVAALGTAAVGTWAHRWFATRQSEVSNAQNDWATEVRERDAAELMRGQYAPLLDRVPGDVRPGAREFQPGERPEPVQPLRNRMLPRVLPAVGGTVAAAPLLLLGLPPIALVGQAGLIAVGALAAVADRWLMTRELEHSVAVSDGIKREAAALRAAADKALAEELSVLLDRLNRVAGATPYPAGAPSTPATSDSVTPTLPLGPYVAAALPEGVGTFARGLEGMLRNLDGPLQVAVLRFLVGSIANPLLERMRATADSAAAAQQRQYDAATAQLDQLAVDTAQARAVLTAIDHQVSLLEQRAGLPPQAQAHSPARDAVERAAEQLRASLPEQRPRGMRTLGAHLWHGALTSSTTVATMVAGTALFHQPWAGVIVGAAAGTGVLASSVSRYLFRRAEQTAADYEAAAGQAGDRLTTSAESAALARFLTEFAARQAALIEHGTPPSRPVGIPVDLGAAHPGYPDFVSASVRLEREELYSRPGPFGILRERLAALDRMEVLADRLRALDARAADPGTTPADAEAARRSRRVVERALHRLRSDYRVLILDGTSIPPDSEHDNAVRAALHGTAPDNPGPDDPGQHPLPGQTGGARPPDDGTIRGYERTDRWATDAYEAIRTSDDVNAIVAHLTDRTRPDGTRGFTRSEVERVKRHIFEDTHPLEAADGTTVHARFDPNADMAEAWLRLRAGRALPEDVALLEHELAEARHWRDNPSATYREAHEAANQVSRWEDRVPPSSREDYSEPWR